MAKPKDLKFKPYVGHFFSFTKENPDIGQNIYSNYLVNKEKWEELPDTILVVDEKRNFVRFVAPDTNSYWTRKTHIEPAELPTYEGNPIPVFEEIRDFLVYCTDTRIADFRIEEMTSRALDLIPKINALIEEHRAKYVPK